MTKEQEAQQAQTIAEIREFQQLRRELGKLTVAAQNIDKLLEIVDSQAQKIAEQEEKLHRIAEWCKSYPIDVFPEPDFEIANSLLKNGGMSTASIAASMARHIMAQIEKIMKMTTEQTTDSKEVEP